jgi:hypothetical protein
MNYITLLSLSKLNTTILQLLLNFGDDLLFPSLTLAPAREMPVPLATHLEFFSRASNANPASLFIHVTSFNASCSPLHFSYSRSGHRRTKFYCPPRSRKSANKSPPQSNSGSFNTSKSVSPTCHRIWTISLSAHAFQSDDHAITHNF